jgi:hypothetical protein
MSPSAKRRRTAVRKAKRQMKRQMITAAAHAAGAETAQPPPTVSVARAETSQQLSTASVARAETAQPLPACGPPLWSKEQIAEGKVVTFVGLNGVAQVAVLLERGGQQFLIQFGGGQAPAGTASPEQKAPPPLTCVACGGEFDANGKLRTFARKKYGTVPKTCHSSKSRAPTGEGLPGAGASARAPRGGGAPDRQPPPGSSPGAGAKAPEPRARTAPGPPALELNSNSN